MAFSDIFRSKENTESQVSPMKIFDNITEIVRDDLQKTIKKNGRVSVMLHKEVSLNQDK